MITYISYHTNSLEKAIKNCTNFSVESFNKIIEKYTESESFRFDTLRKNYGELLESKFLNTLSLNFETEKNINFLFINDKTGPIGRWQAFELCIAYKNNAKILSINYETFMYLISESKTLNRSIASTINTLFQLYSNENRPISKRMAKKAIKQAIIC